MNLRQALNEDKSELRILEFNAVLYKLCLSTGVMVNRAEGVYVNGGAMRTPVGMTAIGVHVT